MPPLNVCLKAFEMRLRTIFSQLSRSTYRLSHGRAVDRELQGGALHGGLELAGELDRQPHQIGGLKVSLGTARLDAREVEESIDQLQEAKTLTVYGLDALTVQGFGTRFQMRQLILERPQHEGERRAEFVADVAKEGRLGAVQLGELGVRGSQLVDRGRQLLAALEHFAFHLV